MRLSRLQFALLVLGAPLGAARQTATAQGRAAPDSAAPMASVALPPALDRVLRDYENAWRAGDAAALAALFTTDGFVLQNGQPAVRGRTAIERAYAGQRGELHLRALAYAAEASTGYMIGAYGYPAPDAPAGAAVPDAGKFTLTLRRVDGRWLIFSDMDNANRRMPRPPANAAPSTTAPER